jgi:hypothetical protein
MCSNSWLRLRQKLDYRIKNCFNRNLGATKNESFKFFALFRLDGVGFGAVCAHLRILIFKCGDRTPSDGALTSLSCQAAAADYENNKFGESTALELRVFVVRAHAAHSGFSERLLMLIEMGD